MHPRPLAESPPTLHPRLDRALQALDGLPAKQQLQFACQLVTALLELVRPRFENSPDDRAAFDVLCGDTLAQLRTDINRLRFAKPH